MHHWWTMGGYGYYIWTAYGIVAISLFVYVVCGYRQWRRLQRVLSDANQKKV